MRENYTPATFNTAALGTRLKTLWTERFGGDRVVDTQAVMAGEDFGRYHLADPQIESMIFWVGGVPLAKWATAQSGGATLPSLHSPFWAPEAEIVISTATEAMTAAALELLKN